MKLFPKKKTLYFSTQQNDLCLTKQMLKIMISRSLLIRDMVPSVFETKQKLLICNEREREKDDNSFEISSIAHLIDE